MSKRQRRPRLRLDPDLGLPVYRQIVQQVRAQAGTGRLAPGTRLPTVRALARDLGVNFNTVARAYRVLDRDGYISTQQGRGTFVSAASARRRGSPRALRTLAAAFIGHARSLRFSDSQISGTLQLLLGAHGDRAGQGEKHE